jgi:hypothetical protein
MTTTTVPDAPARHELLSALAEVFGRKPSAIRTAGYLEATSDIPLEELRAGVQHAMRAHRYMPSPAELRVAVDATRVTEQLALGVLEDTDPRLLVHCQYCCDTGWAFRDEWRAEGQANVVRRCVCAATNPKLVAQRKPYAAQEERRA